MEAEHPTHLTPAPTVLRQLLDAVLITDSDFEAFCLDFFPSVSKRFASGNDRVQKTTLLLRLVEHRQILLHLQEAYPDKVAKHVGLIKYAAAPPPARRTTGRGLLVGAIAIALALTTAAGLLGRHVGEHRFRTMPRTDADGGPPVSASADGPAPPSSRDADAADRARVGLPMLKILNERQRKNAIKLTAPVTSIEKFFQNALDIGADAELVTYKKLDPKQRQWITHVVLFDSRNDRPVSMIIYSEAQYQAWVSNTGSVGVVIRDVLIALEKTLSDIAEYRVPASRALLDNWAKETMTLARLYSNGGSHYMAAMTAMRVAEPGLPISHQLKAEAWALVGQGACASGQNDMAAKAVRGLDSFSSPDRNRIITWCRDRGLEWNGSSFTKIPH